MAFRNWKQELEDQRPPGPSPWPFVLRCGAGMVLLAAGTCVALWVWPGYLKPKPWVRPGPPPQEIVLMFSSDLRGYIEPCGCTEQRWGGVARLIGAVNSVRQPRTKILLEVGDMAAGAAAWQQINLEYYLSALAKAGFTAANIGSAEAQMSAQQIRQLAARSAVPLVSANVLDAGTGEPLVAPYRQIFIDNLRVTVAGVASADPVRPLGAGVRIGDIDECLGRLLPPLRPHTDVIVLLASCDELTMQAIAQAHPELDVILGGRVAQASAELLTVGSCRLAWHANKGQMVGRMDVEIGPDGRPGQARSSMIVLDNDVPEDAEMVDLAARYNAELARLCRQGGLAAMGVAFTAKPAGANTYVGSEACRPCHPTAYKVWADSDHSRAYSKLVRRQRDSNPDCVSCHVVDLGAGDGFAGIDLTPQRANVQCESCHGRAGEHVAARGSGAPAGVGKMTRVLPKSCQTCHDCVHSPQFSFVPYWEPIKHGLE